MRRIVALFLALVCFAAPALAEPTTKPSLAIIGSEAHYPAEDRRLVSVIQDHLKPLQRFTVVTLVAPEGRSAFSGAESRARAIAEASSASALVMVGFEDDPTANFVHYTDIQGEYICQSRVDYVLTQVSDGKLLDRKALLYRGESPSSREAAEQYAYDHVAEDIVRALEQTYRLSTTIVTRRGRVVTFTRGSDVGLQSGMFLAPEASGSPDRIRVTEVASDSARGEIVTGYYDWKVGDQAVEQAYASFPAAVGVTRTQWLGPRAGFFNGMTVDYNRSGLGWGASLEIGQLYQDGVGGFGLFPRLVAQREWVPERLWGYAEAGAGVGLLTQGIPGTVNDATSYALHGLVGLGLSGQLFGSLGASLGLSYLTPWVADHWTQSTGTFNPADVSPLVPHPLLGGWGLHASLSWEF